MFRSAVFGASLTACKRTSGRKAASQAPLFVGRLPFSPSRRSAGGGSRPPRQEQSVPCWGRRTDTDAYEEDLGYDSDDYYESPCAEAEDTSGTSDGASFQAKWPAGSMWPAGAAAVAAAAVTFAAEAGTAGAQDRRQDKENEEAGAGGDGSEPCAGNDPSGAPPLLSGSALRWVLVLATAVLAFLQRLQVAVLATVGATLLLLRQLVRAAGAQARRLGLCARRGLRRSNAGDRVEQLLQNAREMGEQLPEDFWGKLLWLWDRPPVQKLRLTWSLANISIKLPAVLALVATQVGLLASQVSLPMLAPLLLGTGMLLRSIKSNASFLLPRIGLFVVLAWLLWFVNSVVQSTVAYLRRQGALDNRIASALITASECSALLGALLILLSMLGVNIGSALLLPAGIAVAIAAKDLSHNWLAGFFLFVAQPFKMGDRVAVSFTSPGAPGSFTSNWFEGVCEKIDLRYTSIRQGSRRLMVPNSVFLTREFIIMDDLPSAPAPGSPREGAQAQGGVNGGPMAGGYGLAGYRSSPLPQEMRGGPAMDAMQQMMQQPPYHQELLNAEEGGRPAWQGSHEQQQQLGRGRQRGQQQGQPPPQQWQQQQQAGAGAGMGAPFVPPPPTEGSMPWPGMGQPSPYHSPDGRELPGYHSSNSGGTVGAYYQPSSGPRGISWEEA